MWTGYLFAAEIHFQNVFIDRSNGIEASYEKTRNISRWRMDMHHCTEKTTYQQRWARLQRLSYSVIFEDVQKEETISEIFRSLGECNDYFRSIILARLMGYFAAAGDFTKAVRCAKQCIAVGEETGCDSIPHWPTVFWRAVLSPMNSGRMRGPVRHCASAAARKRYSGVLRAKNDYGPVLQFACDNGIEPFYTRQLMDFAGYKAKKCIFDLRRIFRFPVR
jgi:hypothetical protein